jgi:hypothetical protein
MLVSDESDRHQRDPTACPNGHALIPERPRRALAKPGTDKHACAWYCMTCKTTIYGDE